MADTVADNYQLKWHSFSAHLHSSVATLLRSESFTDVVLCASDGHVLPAHRFVLSSCSQYFAAIFDRVRQGSALPLYVVLPPDISARTLRTLVRYMYSGETTVSNDILDDVLKGGDLLKIRGLWRQKNEALPGQPCPPLATPIDSKAHPKVLTKLQEDVAKSQNNLNAANKQKSIKQTPKTNLKVTKGAQVKRFRIVEPGQSRDKSNAQSQDGAEKKIRLEIKRTDSTNKSSISGDVTSPGAESTKPEYKVIDKSSPKIIPVPVKEKTDNRNYQLLIKQEPVEWAEYDSDAQDGGDQEYQTEITIKPEIIYDEEGLVDMEDTMEEEPVYSPLTCELCAETFALPADWVRHIEGHADPDTPAKRQRRGRNYDDDTDKDNIAALRCDLCSRMFPTPAEWVRHVQSTHTETELALSNNSVPPRPRVRSAAYGGGSGGGGNVSDGGGKTCSTCDKKFPSNASMVIHKRTHTGERPFLCTFCQKGFNVKSNLLRHLRTLHDQIVSPADVGDSKPDNEFPEYPGPAVC